MVAILFNVRESKRLAPLALVGLPLRTDLGTYNVAAAVHIARRLGPGHTIVTILCDYGTRYQSKLFNPEFLRTKNLPIPGWLERTPEIAVPFEKVA